MYRSKSHVRDPPFVVHEISHVPPDVGPGVLSGPSKGPLKLRWDPASILQHHAPAGPCREGGWATAPALPPTAVATQSPPSALPWAPSKVNGGRNSGSLRPHRPRVRLAGKSPTSGGAAIQLQHATRRPGPSRGEGSPSVRRLEKKTQGYHEAPRPPEDSRGGSPDAFSGTTCTLQGLPSSPRGPRVLRRSGTWTGGAYMCVSRHACSA